MRSLLQKITTRQPVAAGRFVWQTGRLRGNIGQAVYYYVNSHGAYDDGSAAKHGGLLCAYIYIILHFSAPSVKKIFIYRLFIAFEARA